LSNNLGHFIELTAKSINRRSGVCLCRTSLLVCLVFCRGKTETVLWFYGTVHGNLYSLSIIAKRSVGLRETFGQLAELQSTQLAYVAELPLAGLYMCCPGQTFSVVSLRHEVNMAIDLKSCCSRSCRLVCTNTTTLSPRSAQVHQDSAVLTYFNLASLDYAKCCFVECKWRTELRPKRSPCDCAKSLRKTRLLFVLASFSAVSVGSGLDLHLRGKNSSSQNLDVQGAPIKTGPF